MTRVAVALVAVLCLSTPVHADVERGDTGPQVRQVQEHLRWYGYTVAVDGQFGRQTDRAVRHYQHVNGLEVDGIVGPVTADALGIATRGPQIQLTEPPPAPTPTFANDCDEMSWYRQQAGLPEHFDTIGYRESRCRNDVGNYCCHGWWQNYLSSHLSSQSAYRGRIINECGVTTVAHIRGLTPAQKTAQACVTKVLYDISGYKPWAMTA